MWHHCCELFFDRFTHFNQEKVTNAAYYMFGVAQLCYKKRLQDGHQFSWMQFKEAFTLHLGPPRSINPLVELANLKQSG